MTDVITICGVIIGVLLLILGKKRPNLKLLNLCGILIIIISLVIGAPDLINGFKEGYNSARKS